MAILGFLRNLLRRKAPPFVYADWIAEAEAALAIKQDALTEGYGLGTWPVWNAELGQGSLTFSDEQGIQVFAEVQIAGTLGKKPARSCRVAATAPQNQAHGWRCQKP